MLVLRPEFATCKAKTESFRTPLYAVNMQFSLYLLELKFFEKIYLHYVPI